MKTSHENIRLQTLVSTWLARPTKANSAHDVPELRAALGSTLGDVRQENQDRAIIAKFFSDADEHRPTLLFALCDGMGGMADGAWCAETALGQLVSFLVSAESGTLATRLTEAIVAANSQIYARLKGRGGTTIAALLLSKNEAVAATVGDSRIYTIERGKRARQISADDTIAGELSRMKGVDPSKLDLGHLGSGLAQFVGIGEGIEPRIYHLGAMSSEATFCLTSDGAHGIGSPTFERVLAASPNPFASVTRVLSLSRWCGGQDNATIVLGGGSANVANDAAWPMDYRHIQLWDPLSTLEFVFDVGAEVAKDLPNAPPQKTLTANVGPYSRENALPSFREPKRKRKRDGTQKPPTTPLPDIRRQSHLEIEIEPGPPDVAQKGSNENLEASDPAPSKQTQDPERPEPPEEGNGSV